MGAMATCGVLHLGCYCPFLDVRRAELCEPEMEGNSVISMMQRKAALDSDEKRPKVVQVGREGKGLRRYRWYKGGGLGAVRRTKGKGTPFPSPPIIPFPYLP